MNWPVILHADYFSRSGFGQGLSHRAEQIGEVLKRVGPPVVRVEVNPSTISKPTALFWGIRHLWIRGYRSPHRLPLVCRYGRRLAALVNFFRQQPPGSCVVWCVTDDWVIPEAARLAALPVIAAPMMIESFVQFAHVVMGGGTVWDRLRFEIDRINLSTSITCASREEQWLLAGFGCGSDILPIYPASALLDHLLSLREQRFSSRAGPLLILSSYSNPTNRTGVVHLANLLASIPDPRPTVVLAGYGTDRFRDMIPDGLFSILGELEQSRLDELMIKARAMLIWQDSGTGALTRIPEALAAGVPVLCNAIAARSACHYRGVYVFEDSRELVELLDKDLPTPPVPPRPEAAERRFVEVVRGVMGLSPA